MAIIDGVSAGDWLGSVAWNDDDARVFGDDYPDVLYTRYAASEADRIREAVSGVDGMPEEEMMSAEDELTLLDVAYRAYARSGVIRDPERCRAVSDGVAGVAALLRRERLGLDEADDGDIGHAASSLLALASDFRAAHNSIAYGRYRDR